MVDPALVPGAAVRTACRIWLKDHATVADSVVEIIQARVTEAREQRRVRERWADTMTGIYLHAANLTGLPT